MREEFLQLNNSEKLLQQANYFFEKRQLAEALHILQNFQSIPQTNDENENNRVAIDLLLARVYATKGLYESSHSETEKAIQILEKGLPKVADEAARFWYQLELAKAYQHHKDTAKAQYYRTQAEKWALNQAAPHQIILTKIAACQAAIQNNAFDEAQDLAQACQDILSAHTSLDAILQASVFNLLGRIQIKRQDIVEALKISKVALDISRNNADVENELTALNNLAIVHGIKSEYKESMEYLMEALAISKQIGYREQTARCQINMGSIYAHLFNHQQALAQYKNVVEKHFDLIETGTQIAVCNNMGNIYYNLQDAKTAENYFQKAYDMAQTSQYQEMQGLSLAQLARTYQAQGVIPKALKTALAAKEVLDQLGTVNGSQIVRINLGKIYYEMGDLSQAIKHLSQGIVFAKTLKDDLSQIRAYDVLSKVYFKQKNLEQAYKYLQIYTAYREEYSKVQRNRQLLDLEIQYGFQEKQKEIERLQLENEYQALLLEQKSKIETQNQQLTEANTELKQFASIVSHDLKEPLRMIGSFSKLLADKHQNDFDEQSKEYSTFVVDGVERMDKLLRGLMYYATVGKEYESTQMVDLQELMSVCCLHLRVSIQEANAKVRYENLPTISSKYALLIQLFQNLISNAIKFRAADRAPLVLIEASESEQHYTITVKDNGIGIPKRSLNQVFKIFQRLHSAEAYKGTGVGLAVCQKIVKRLGGKIWAESTVGEGTTFFVELEKE